MKKMNFKLAAIAFCAFMLVACGSDDATDEMEDEIEDEIEDDETEPDPVDISTLASKFYHTDAVSVTFDDTWVTITSSNLPDHKSMYYPEDDPL